MANIHTSHPHLSLIVAQNHQKGMMMTRKVKDTKLGIAEREREREEGITDG